MPVRSETLHPAPLILFIIKEKKSNKIDSQDTLSIAKAQCSPSSESQMKNLDTDYNIFNRKLIYLMILKKILILLTFSFSIRNFQALIR